MKRQNAARKKKLNPRWVMDAGFAIVPKRAPVPSVGGEKPLSMLIAARQAKGPILSSRSTAKA